jgi:hypothetical protein
MGIDEGEHFGKGFDGSQSLVSCSGAIGPLIFDVVEKGDDSVERKMFHLKLWDRDMMMAGCKGDEEGKGIPIGSDRLYTCALEVGQIMVKELDYGV